MLQLQGAVGCHTIQDLEDGMASKARGAWARHPNILVAGNTSGQRVGIVAFQVGAFVVCLVRGRPQSQSRLSR